jgi:hypothetical protein
MGNKWDEMRAAYQEAETTIRAADSMVEDMAKMIVGKLKTINRAYILKRLKRELRSFNINTGRWMGK